MFTNVGTDLRRLIEFVTYTFLVAQRTFSMQAMQRYHCLCIICNAKMCTENLVIIFGGYL